MSIRHVTLLHGWGTHPVIWDPLLEKLPGAHALPLPGYAGSPAAFTLEEMAERLGEQLEKGTLLVGWSLGGLVAARIALRFPQRVCGLVLIAATPCFVNRPGWAHGIEAEVFEQFAAGLQADYAGTIRRFLSLQAQGSSETREVLAQLRRRLLDQPRPAQGVLEAGLEMLKHADLREGLKSLDLPLTLIHGAGDKLAPLSAAQWLAGNQPHASLHVVQGAGHAPFLSHAGQVSEMIEGAAHG